MRPDVLKLLNGHGSIVLLPTKPRGRAANDPRLPLPTTGALEAWWRIDDLWRRASARITPSVNIPRRQVGWQGIARLPADVALALGSLNTYRWHDGDHWASVARLIVVDPDAVTVTLIEDARLLRMPEGEQVMPHLSGLLRWLADQADDKR